MAIMVLVCAMLGTVAMGMMFDPTVVNESPESFNSYAANGSYWAFQKLGQYYHVGNLFLIVYASCILGMYNDDKFTMALNIITPLVLTALGFFTQF